MPMPEHTRKSKKLSKKIVALANSLQENKLHRREKISEELRML